MKLTKLFFAAFIVLSANASFAQKVATHLVNINIPPVALLDLKVASGTTDITLAGTAPTIPGDPMTFGTAATNATIWMNYSSIVGTTLPTRNVSVELSSAVPTGLKLTVEAGVAATGLGFGEGNLGTPSTVLNLTTSSQNIVTLIGSSYTGNGADKGRKLTYKLDYASSAAANYKDLKFDVVPQLTVTYTLSDI